MMGTTSVFGFGKYRGLSVRAVAKFNPEYLAWVSGNMSNVKFDDAALAVIRPALRDHRQQSSNRQQGWAWGFGRSAKNAAASWRSKMIEIEHRERRAAGQDVCPACFPNAWNSCAQCRGAGWITQIGGAS